MRLLFSDDVLITTTAQHSSVEALSWEICFIWHNRICKKKNKKKLNKMKKFLFFCFFKKRDIQCLYCKGELGGTLKAMKKVNNTLMLINLQTLFVVQSQFRVDFNLISCWFFFVFVFFLKCLKSITM